MKVWHAEKEGCFVVTKIVFFGIAKNAILEKSANGCEHVVETWSEGQKAQEIKMLSSVPCATGFHGSCERMGEWLNKMKN
jgi:hypothetical protein